VNEDGLQRVATTILKINNAKQTNHLYEDTQWRSHSWATAHPNPKNNNF